MTSPKTPEVWPSAGKSANEKIFTGGEELEKSGGRAVPKAENPCDKNHQFGTE
jgi:hypothetical protein